MILSSNSSHAPGKSDAPGLAVSAMLFVWLLTLSVQANVMKVLWDELPALPPSHGQLKQPGVAGPFAGVHGTVLIVAGGANFPDRMPWDGGVKVWVNDVWVLEQTPDSGLSSGVVSRWVSDKHFSLPRRLGYGLSVNTTEGVICAGGNDAERCYAEVFLLAWDSSAREVRRTPLPSMPQPLAMMTGALVGQTLFVAGGQHTMNDAKPSSAFWALDLSKRGRPEEFKWIELPTWPGPARIVPVAAAQSTKSGEEFFLFSGRVQQAGQRTRVLRDAYAFNPKARTWRTLPAIGGGAGVSVMAGTAAAVGESEILLFGGDRGDVFLELEAHDMAIAAARVKLNSAAVEMRAAIEHEIGERLQAKRKIYDTHTGFGREIFAYNTVRDTWRVVGESLFPPQVTTSAVRWGDSIVIPSGEVRPGVRTPSVVRARPVLK